MPLDDTAPTRVALSPRKLLIGGTSRGVAGGATMTTTGLATEEVITEVAKALPADVDAAVQAAALREQGAEALLAPDGRRGARKWPARCGVRLQRRSGCQRYRGKAGDGSRREAGGRRSPERCSVDGAIRAASAAVCLPEATWHTHWCGDAARINRRTFEGRLVRKK